VGVRHDEHNVDDSKNHLPQSKLKCRKILQKVIIVQTKGPPKKAYKSLQFFQLFYSAQKTQKLRTMRPTLRKEFSLDRCGSRGVSAEYKFRTLLTSQEPFFFASLVLLPDDNSRLAKKPVLHFTDEENSLDGNCFDNNIETFSGQKKKQSCESITRKVKRIRYSFDSRMDQQVSNEQLHSLLECPNEIFLSICAYLTVPDLSSLASASQLMYKKVNADQGRIWKMLFDNYAGKLVPGLSWHKINPYWDDYSPEQCFRHLINSRVIHFNSLDNIQVEETFQEIRQETSSSLKFLYFFCERLSRERPKSDKHTIKFKKHHVHCLESKESVQDFYGKMIVKQVRAPPTRDRRSRNSYDMSQLIPFIEQMIELMDKVDGYSEWVIKRAILFYSLFSISTTEAKEKLVPREDILIAFYLIGDSLPIQVRDEGFHLGILLHKYFNHMESDRLLTKELWQRYYGMDYDSMEVIPIKQIKYDDNFGPAVSFLTLWNRVADDLPFMVPMLRHLRISFQIMPRYELNPSVPHSPSSVLSEVANNVYRHIHSSEVREMVSDRVFRSLFTPLRRADRFTIAIYSDNEVYAHSNQQNTRVYLRDERDADARNSCWRMNHYGQIETINNPNFVLVFTEMLHLELQMKVDCSFADPGYLN